MRLAITATVCFCALYTADSMLTHGEYFRGLAALFRDLKLGLGWG
jgi:hypothetical protein